MILRILITVVLSIAAGHGIARALDESDAERQDDQDIWESISVPSTFEFDCEDASSLLTDADEVPLDKPRYGLRNLSWKPGVRLFRVPARSVFILFADSGDKACRITHENVGYYLAGVNSEAEAMELAALFHEGIIFLQDSDINSLIDACTSSDVAIVADGPFNLPHPSSTFVDALDSYRVTFTVYENMNVTVMKYVIDAEGHIGYVSVNVVDGPPVITGWYEQGKEYHDYRDTVLSFENSIQNALANAVESLLQDSNLDDLGLSKARENGFSWLLQGRNLRNHAVTIRQFIEEHETTIDKSLLVSALARLRRSGVNLTDEEIKLLEDSSLDAEGR
ncbi:MAG: hypothetical protein KKG33_10390 [candidate division Zixibacteria bacterium]|nr:hypothetical protein [candidate division Zixibacteria bacterium]